MQGLASILPLIILIAIMYFLMIKPQKKRDKEVADMRKGLTVGDEIITIGGIVGKIVKTKDETVVISVGADKVKFEVTRWAISTVTKPSAKRDARVEETEEAPKKILPKRLKKAEEAVEEVAAPVEEAAAAVEETVEEVKEEIAE